LSPKRWKQPPRGVVDTSVLVAGVSGFREEPTDTPSAALLAVWTEAPTFVWLLTEEILSEYAEVLHRLKDRAASTIIAWIREEGQLVRTIKKIGDLPDPDDAPFCECAESGNADFIVNLNPGDFPQYRLKAKVIAPNNPLSPRARKRDRGTSVSLSARNRHSGKSWLGAGFVVNAVSRVDYKVAPCAPATRPSG
jgi:predicted nucleic acid-binding protein